MWIFFLLLFADPGEFPGLTPGPDAQVVRAVDGARLILADGAYLRLMDLAVPLDADSVAADRSKQALDRLSAGKNIRLFLTPQGRDRYGDFLGHAVTDDGLWLQAELLRQGEAQLDPESENPDLLAALYKAEDEARRQGLGLWRVKAFSVLPVEQADEAALGQFRILTGRVRSARPSPRGFFLNFGEDWATDTTVFINRGHLRRFGGRDRLEALVDQRVEIRGVIDRWNGPFLVITRPGSLRRLTEPPLSRSSVR